MGSEGSGWGGDGWWAPCEGVSAPELHTWTRPSGKFYVLCILPSRAMWLLMILALVRFPDYRGHKKSTVYASDTLHPDSSRNSGPPSAHHFPLGHHSHVATLPILKRSPSQETHLEFPERTTNGSRSHWCCSQRVLGIPLLSSVVTQAATVCASLEAGCPPHRDPGLGPLSPVSEGREATNREARVRLHCLAQERLGAGPVGDQRPSQDSRRRSRGLRVHPCAPLPASLSAEGAGVGP